LTQTQQQSRAQPKLKPSSTVYWLRVGLAIAAGVANDLLGISEATLGPFAFSAAVGLALLFYLFSVLVVKNLLHYGEAELKGKNRYITLGGGTFIMVWVMVAVLLYTVTG